MLFLGCTPLRIRSLPRGTSLAGVTASHRLPDRRLNYIPKPSSRFWYIAQKSLCRHVVWRSLHGDSVTLVMQKKKKNCMQTSLKHVNKHVSMLTYMLTKQICLHGRSVSADHSFIMPAAIISVSCTTYKKIWLLLKALYIYHLNSLQQRPFKTKRQYTYKKKQKNYRARSCSAATRKTQVGTYISLQRCSQDRSFTYSCERLIFAPNKAQEREQRYNPHRLKLSRPTHTNKKGAKAKVI